MVTASIDEVSPEPHPGFFRHMNRKTSLIKSMLGGEWVQLEENMRPLYVGLKKGEIWSMLFDAQPRGVERRKSFPFSGGTISMPYGLVRIAEKTQARFVYLTTDENDQGQLNCKIHPLPFDPEAGFRAAVQAMERDISAKPWLWWQWNILEYIWAPSPEKDTLSL